MVILGIDSGGTKAAFLLTDDAGHVLARHIAPGCAVLDARKQGVRSMVQDGLAEICRLSGIPKERIDVLGLGISGYGEGEGTELETQEACAEAFFPGKCVCNLDTYIGWAGSLLFEPGINIISGTGAIVFGVASNGQTARASGWGAGCDEGSCSWHGQRLIEAFTKQSDGRMQKTKLYTLFREKYHITGEDERFIMPLNREVVRGGKGLAQLQYLLKEAYEADDETARAIYEAGAQELFLSVQAVARRLGFGRGNLKVSYSGGLFKSGDCALSPLRKRIENAGGQLIAPRFPPEVGAVLMALRFLKPDHPVQTFELKEM